jgi:hypothetical protein
MYRARCLHPLASHVVRPVCVPANPIAEEAKRGTGPLFSFLQLRSELKDFVRKEGVEQRVGEEINGPKSAGYAVSMRSHAAKRPG